MGSLAAILFATSVLALSQGLSPIQLVEPHRENCTDMNAEFRYDDPKCVVTCHKKTITENPGGCFEKNVNLTPGCYCKENFVLDEGSNRCVEKRLCPCNEKNMEQSRFHNECGNNCATLSVSCRGRTLPLHMDCWCKYTYCRLGNGTCVPKA